MDYKIESNMQFPLVSYDFCPVKLCASKAVPWFITLATLNLKVV